MREMVCIVCPVGCALTVEQNGEKISVRGNACPKGAAFAREEVLDPKRTLTTTVRVAGGKTPLTSVRSTSPVKKGEMRELVRQLNGITLTAPVAIGQVILAGAGENRAAIVATRRVDKA